MCNSYDPLPQRPQKCLGFYDYACSFITYGSVLEIGPGTADSLYAIDKSMPRDEFLFAIEEPYIARENDLEYDVQVLNSNGRHTTLIQLDINKHVSKFGRDVDGDSNIRLVIAQHVVSETQYWEQIIDGMAFMLDADGGYAIISIPYKPLRPTVKDCGKYTVEHETFYHILNRWFTHVTMNFARIRGNQFSITTKTDWRRNNVIYICS